MDTGRKIPKQSSISGKRGRQMAASRVSLTLLVLTANATSVIWILDIHCALYHHCINLVHRLHAARPIYIWELPIAPHPFSSYSAGWVEKAALSLVLAVQPFPNILRPCRVLERSTTSCVHLQIKTNINENINLQSRIIFLATGLSSLNENCKAYLGPITIRLSLLVYVTNIFSILPRPLGNHYSSFTPSGLCGNSRYWTLS